MICLAVRFQSIQTLFSGYSLYQTFPKDGLTHLTDKYKWMGFLASLPVVGLILPIETVYRELKKGVSNKIIGRSFALTLIDPAVLVCFTTIFYASSNKAIVSKSWIFILFLAMGCFIVMGAEVAMLIVCIVFCLEEIYYVPLMFLYLVLLWLYLTRAVIYIKTTIGG
ncbi:uncharacterized protein LOC128552289 [Mercenaria mercenaria]|uniref:uncharacterized protein LOC128552289 n=1 Tax=Mercenaria mercenaria TaxID=6596 RepID=UPI00234F7753|nr:uncharacterized protein LOC128552289 [Mercenaria mercenaria]